MKAKILAIDDEPTTREIIDAGLCSAFEVITASTGEDGLELIGNMTRTPDLILLDAMMPGLSGFEVCRKLKSRRRTRQIPIIFLTARDDEHSEAIAMSLGADEYIAKPVSIPVLLTRVKTQLMLQKYVSMSNAPAAAAC